MKMTFRQLSLILILSMISSTVFASVPTIVADYDGTKVTLEGTTVGNTVVKILPHSVEEEALSDGTPPVDIDFFTTNGTYTYELRMPTTALSGKYRAYVVNGSGTASDSFMYYIPSNALSILPLINSAETPNIMYNLIANNATDLGIDTEDADYNAYGARSCEILHYIGINPQSVPEFNDIYYAGIALAAMEGKEPLEVNSILSKYDSRLGIDYTTDYSGNSALTEDMKSDILYLYANTNFSEELRSIKNQTGSIDFNMLYDRITALSAVRNSGSWKRLKAIYQTDYNAMLGSIMNSNPLYSTVNDEDVFYVLSSSDYQFTKYSDLKTNFDLAVSYVVNISNSNITPPSTGGGGGGYTTPGTAINSSDDYESGSTVDEPNTPTKQASYAMPVLGAGYANYNDVPENHWASPAISALGGSAIISGYPDGSFRPNDSITRAEFAKLVVSAFSVDASSDTVFSDVNAEDWYAPYITKGEGSGLITGYNGTFNPTGNISRQDAAVILYRMTALAGLTYSGSATFDDLTSISVYALTAVRSLANAGIISGDENYRFNPTVNLSRAEAAKLIYSLIGSMTAKLNEGGK